MLTVANLITLFRIALVPVFVLTFVYSNRHGTLPWLSLGIFSTAAILDGVDGFVARVFNQKTKLGAFLDPLADKLLVTMVYIIGTRYGIPVYITVLVVSRDLLIVVGWVALFYFDRDAEIRPIRISKVNTVCQFLTAGLFLLHLATSDNGGIPAHIMQGAFYIVLGTTLLSTTAYFFEWYRRMGGFTREADV